MKPLGNKVGVCHGWILDSWERHASQDKAKAKSRGTFIPYENPIQRYSKRIFAALLSKILASEILVTNNFTQVIRRYDF